jgi:branched-chain amino acid transport system ATP-binding protein
MTTHTPNKPPALCLRGVGLSHGATRVLEGVDLTVHQGERLALIGPNGAGKSSLFQVVSGLQAPSHGEVYLNGQRIDGRAAHEVARLGLARSFQISHLFGALSVRDNLLVAGYDTKWYSFLLLLMKTNRTESEEKHCGNQNSHSNVLWKPNVLLVRRYGQVSTSSPL